MAKETSIYNLSDYALPSASGGYEAEVAAGKLKAQKIRDMGKTLLAANQQKDQVAATEIYGKALGNMYDGDRAAVEKMRTYVEDQQKNGGYSSDPSAFARSVAQLNAMSTNFSAFHTQSYGTGSASGTGSTYSDILYNQKTGNDPYADKDMQAVGDVFEGAQGTLNFMNSGGYAPDSIYIDDQGVMMARSIDMEGNIGDYVSITDLPHRQLGAQAFMPELEERKTTLVDMALDSKTTISSIRSRTNPDTGKQYTWDEANEVFFRNEIATNPRYLRDILAQRGISGEDSDAYFNGQATPNSKLEIEGQLYGVRDANNSVVNANGGGALEAWQREANFGIPEATEGYDTQYIDHTISANGMDLSGSVGGPRPFPLDFEYDVSAQTIDPLEITQSQHTVDGEGYSVTAISSDHNGNKFVSVPTPTPFIVNGAGEQISLAEATPDQRAAALDPDDESYELETIDVNEWIQINPEGNKELDPRAGEIYRNLVMHLNGEDAMGARFDGMRGESVIRFNNRFDQISALSAQNAALRTASNVTANPTSVSGGGGATVNSTSVSGGGGATNPAVSAEIKNHPSQGIFGLNSKGAGPNVGEDGSASLDPETEAAMRANQGHMYDREHRADIKDLDGRMNSIEETKALAAEEAERQRLHNKRTALPPEASATIPDEARPPAFSDSASGKKFKQRAVNRLMKSGLTRRQAIEAINSESFSDELAASGYEAESGYNLIEGAKDLVGLGGRKQMRADVDSTVDSYLQLQADKLVNTQKEAKIEAEEAQAAQSLKKDKVVKDEEAEWQVELDEYNAELAKREILEGYGADTSDLVMPLSPHAKEIAARAGDIDFSNAEHAAYYWKEIDGKIQSNTDKDLLESVRQFGLPPEDSIQYKTLKLKYPHSFEEAVQAKERKRLEKLEADGLVDWPSLTDHEKNMAISKMSRDQGFNYEVDENNVVTRGVERITPSDRALAQAELTATNEGYRGIDTTHSGGVLTYNTAGGVGHSGFTIAGLDIGFNKSGNTHEQNLKINKKKLDIIEQFVSPEDFTAIKQLAGLQLSKATTKMKALIASGDLSADLGLTDADLTEMTAQQADHEFTNLFKKIPEADFDGLSDEIQEGITDVWFMGGGPRTVGSVKNAISGDGTWEDALHNYQHFYGSSGGMKPAWKKSYNKFIKDYGYTKNSADSITAFKLAHRLISTSNIKRTEAAMTKLSGHPEAIAEALNKQQEAVDRAVAALMASNPKATEDQIAETTSAAKASTSATQDTSTFASRQEDNANLTENLSPAELFKLKLTITK